MLLCWSSHRPLNQERISFSLVISLITLRTKKKKNHILMRRKRQLQGLLHVKLMHMSPSASCHVYVVLEKKANIESMVDDV